MTLEWYKRFPDKWRNSVRVTRMSFASRGAYSELLDYQWTQRNGYIPNEPDLLWRYSRAESPAEWDLVREQVLPMFAHTPDGKFIYNETLREQWEEASAISRKRSEAGQKGNAIRHSRGDEAEETPEAPESSEPDPIKEQSREAVKRVFAYYLKKTKRAEAQYKLTDGRMAKGVTRFYERLKDNGGDPAKAEQDLMRAIDGMVASSWHMGDNPNNRKYCEWDKHLFLSYEKTESWINQITERPKVNGSGKSLLERSREAREATA